MFDVDVNTNNQVRENTRQPRWRNRMAPGHRITNISLSVTGLVMVEDDWPGRDWVSMHAHCVKVRVSGNKSNTNVLRADLITTIRDLDFIYEIIDPLNSG